MIVRQDVALGADDHARAQAELALILTKAVTEKTSEQGVVIQRVWRLLCLLGRKDIHDRWHCTL